MKLFNSGEPDLIEEVFDKQSKDDLISMSRIILDLL